MTATPISAEQLSEAARYYATRCACGHARLFHAQHDDGPGPCPGPCEECRCDGYRDHHRQRDGLHTGAQVEFKLLGIPHWGEVIGMDSHGVEIRIEAGTTTTWLPWRTIFGAYTAFRVVIDRG